MFEALGTIIRLPVALAWIAFLFITWPIGAGILIGWGLLMCLISPFPFIGFAFLGDKAGWEAWVKEYIAGSFSGAAYPFTMLPGIFKWVETGI